MQLQLPLRHQCTNSSSSVFESSAYAIIGSNGADVEGTLWALIRHLTLSLRFFAAKWQRKCRLSWTLPPLAAIANNSLFWQVLLRHWRKRRLSLQLERMAVPLENRQFAAYAHLAAPSARDFLSVIGRDF